MTIPIIFLFITDLSAALRPPPNAASPTKLGSDVSQVVTVERVGFGAGLPHGGSENGVYPHPLAVNSYYRCRGNRRETWTCTGGFVFDGRSQKCVHGLPDQCHEQEDGLYPAIGSDCRRYTRCEGGASAEEKQCPANELFSHHSQSCRPGSEVTCIAALCSPANDGFFIAPGSKCRGYYSCRKGKRFDFLCPRGEMFDLRTKACVDGGICYEPICVGRTDGVYPDTTHECRRFFRCKGGEMREMESCPGALRHNGFACAPASIVRCEEPQKTAASIYNRKRDPCKQLRDGTHAIPGTDCRGIRSCADGRTVGTSECPLGYRYDGRQCVPRHLTECRDSCSGKKDGRYASADCREYYACSGEKVRERRTCDNGTLFDGTSCARGVARCPGAGRNPCAGLADGFHPDYLDGCRRYFYCHDREVIVASACPAGSKWNGSRCSRGFLCDAPKELSQCRGAPTGVHQDVSSDCRNYVYCHEGNGTVLTCPEGEIHDGTKCRKSEEYTCPSAVRDECHDRPDGYHQDENSNCRSYYYCTNGRKVTYICEGSFIFNGSHCVPPRQYACPYEGNDCDGRFDGYYPDEGTRCRTYFYCLRGKRITSLRCGGRKIFVGNSCVLANDPEGVCEKATRNPCRGRSNGKYSERRSRCEKYVRCENQVAAEEMFCPAGWAFDGVACSPNAACASGSNPCDGRKIGFVPDYASGCRDYYFCVGNLKMTASCPAGSVFNGRVCQDSTTYACPTSPGAI